MDKIKKHKCISCNKSFDRKANFDRHMNKKIACKKNTDDLIPQKEVHDINNIIESTQLLQFFAQNNIKVIKTCDNAISSHIIPYNSHIIPPASKNKVVTDDQSILPLVINELAPNKMDINKDQQIDQNKLHKCNYCGGIYSQACNLARHYKACQEKQKNDQKYQAEIDSLKQQNALLIKEIANHVALLAKEIASHEALLSKEIANNKVEIENYKTEIKTKDRTIRHLTRDYTDSKNKEVEYLKTVVNGAGGVLKTSFNALSYITTNYTKAPVMLPITDQSIITKNDDNFINEIIYSHTNDSLDTKIGDIIIAHYKKTDPKQQSLWTSDVSRLTYIMRTLINNKEDWFIDKKGNGLKANIIDPVLNDYIKPLLLTYIGNQHGLVANVKDGDKFEDIFVRMETANLIIKSINESILADNIIKYIASHFYCQKTDDIKLINE